MPSTLHSRIATVLVASVALTTSLVGCAAVTGGASALCERLPAAYQEWDGAATVTDASGVPSETDQVFFTELTDLLREQGRSESDALQSLTLKVGEVMAARMSGPVDPSQLDGVEKLAQETLAECE